MSGKVSKDLELFSKIYNKNFIVNDKNNNFYSIDMIRLRTRITSDFFGTKLDSRLSSLQNIEKWESTKICDFKYNYLISYDNSSFWLGFISNKELYNGDGGVNNPKHKFNLTIEFNPNKVSNCVLLDYILGLRIDTTLDCGLVWEVVSCDFAFDLDTNILNLTGFDKVKKKCLLTYDNGGEDKTYYIGKGQNRVKIYNKKIESDLSCDLTRIEVSHQFLNGLDVRFIKEFNFDLSSIFPKLYLSNYQLDFSDIEVSDTFKAVIYAVNNGYPLHDLTRYTRDKIKKYLQKKKPIEIDFGCFGLAFYKIVSNWFSDTFR